MDASNERRNVSVALWILAIAAILTALRAAHWMITDSDLPLSRGLLAFVLFGSIGALWYTGYVWLYRRSCTRSAGVGKK